MSCMQRSVGPGTAGTQRRRDRAASMKWHVYCDLSHALPGRVLPPVAPPARPGMYAHVYDNKLEVNR